MAEPGSSPRAVCICQRPPWLRGRESSVETEQKVGVGAKRTSKGCSGDTVLTRDKGVLDHWDSISTEN